MKSNIGHLEPAAGVAGVIKVVLSLQHEEIPPHLHFRTLNPRISLDEAGAVVPTVLTPWPRGAAPRIAGVSSFGMSGTNAHVVLEEAPDEAPPLPAEGIAPATCCPCQRAATRRSRRWRTACGRTSRRTRTSGSPTWATR